MRLVYLSLLALAGCGGGGGEGAAPDMPAQVGRPVAQSDHEIASMVYSGGKRTPEGFPTDEAPAGYWQVTTTHLAGCTDDWNEALAWSETAAQDATAYSDLVETRTDPRYYEFDRVTRSSPATYVRMRVYRCEFFDPVASELNVRPLEATTVAAFAEYQWLFTTYNNFGNVVLERLTRTTAGTIEHVLDLATLTRATAPATCDRVEVVAWVWRVNLATGAVDIRTEPLFGFGAREAAGVVETCAP